MAEQLIKATKVAVWCGLDVGKEQHHACALDATGRRLFDKPLPQDETKLRDVFTGLQHHGRVLMIVDQPNTIGALAVAVANDAGVRVGDSALPSHRPIHNALLSFAYWPHMSPALTLATVPRSRGRPVLACLSSQ